jgi:NAD+ synthase (glutamine-hydrolysing)
VRLALAQMNPTVGDLEGNAARIVDLIVEAEEAGADLAVFPELAITGYPPEDLLLKPGFIADNLAAMGKVAAATGSCAAIVGFVDEQLDLYNAAAVCAGGEIRGVYHKQLLPNYGVFDEQRYFAAGTGAQQLFGIAGVRVGVSICEDAWSPTGPIAAQAAAGAELIVNINASPYSMGRLSERERMLSTRAADSSCVVVYLNCVGGQDELVFDGASLVFDAGGNLLASLGQFREELALVDLDVRPVYRKRLLDPRGHHSAQPLPVATVTDPAARFGQAKAADPAARLGQAKAAEQGRGPIPSSVSANPAARLGQAKAADPAARLGQATAADPAARFGQATAATGTSAPASTLHPGAAGAVAPRLEVEAEVYQALVTGTRDYVRKNGFSDVVIGLSGGIDSSLVALIAVDALGAEHVHGVSMPSRYSSEGSESDAALLAENLGIDFRRIPIEAAHAAFLDMLAGSVTGPPGLTEENIQSRIRGVILMALSNHLGWLVLTTGNKSEAAVGYSTLYGDTAGGFAVVKDVPKTMVYRLCRWRDAAAPQPLLPPEVLVKPPSAELRPDQRDDQSLPPYDVLDPVLMAYVEDDLTASELIEAGFDADLVSRVVRLVDLAEYKRRQMPPGVRVTTKAFGRDRRVPITNGYRWRSC